MQIIAGQLSPPPPKNKKQKKTEIKSIYIIFCKLNVFFENNKTFHVLDHNDDMYICGKTLDYTQIYM